VETDQLEAFDRVVQEGGFGRAAIALGIGQPAVSARIQSLELALGGALFRRGRTVALTALGEAFLPYARRVLEVLREGTDSARMVQSGKHGRIRFGTLSSLAGGLVGPALLAFLRDYPDVECVARSADHEFVVRMLLDGIVDMALISWPFAEHLADVVPLFLLTEPVVLMAHPAHALAKRRAVTADDVARLAQPLIRLRWWPQHEPAVLALAERAGRCVELPKEAARRLVMEGVGAGFFARTYMADAIAEGHVSEVSVSGIAPVRREIALVLRRSAGLSPAGAAWVEALRRQAKKLRLPIQRAETSAKRAGPKA
jgi:DNA-binding transcriptional LysR family regulator